MSCLHKVPAVFLAKFRKVVCACLLLRAEREGLARGHPAGFVPKAGQELRPTGSQEPGSPQKGSLQKGGEEDTSNQTGQLDGHLIPKQTVLHSISEDSELCKTKPCPPVLFFFLDRATGLVDDGNAAHAASTKELADSSKRSQQRGWQEGDGMDTELAEQSEPARIWDGGRPPF